MLFHKFQNMVVRYLSIVEDGIILFRWFIRGCVSFCLVFIYLFIFAFLLCMRPSVHSVRLEFLILLIRNRRGRVTIIMRVCVHLYTYTLFFAKRNWIEKKGTKSAHGLHCQGNCMRRFPFMLMNMVLLFFIHHWITPTTNNHRQFFTGRTRIILMPEMRYGKMLKAHRCGRDL